MARILGMPGPTAGSAVPVGRARTLAQVYRHFGEVDAAETSPLYERVAVALSESDEALRAIEAAPARKRHPTVILAALHALALAGRAACASCTASTQRRPAGRWRGCQRRGSASRRRSRHLAIAAPLATASSVWRCSTGRPCAPRPLAAAGRRAACWRGWQTRSVR